MIRLLALLAVFCAACVAPSQHNPALPPVTVAFETPLDSAGPWRNDQLVELRAELTALNALGPTFIEASEGTAMLVVRPFDSSLRTDNCRNAAGCFTLGNTYVEVDPARTSGYTELRSAVAHEIMHALGTRHVCIEPGETSDCSPVGYGPAVMNPSLSYGDPVDPVRYTGVGTDVPTQLDIDEYNRTRR